MLFSLFLSQIPFYLVKIANYLIARLDFQAPDFKKSANHLLKKRLFWLSAFLIINLSFNYY